MEILLLNKFQYYKNHTYNEMWNKCFTKYFIVVLCIFKITLNVIVYFKLSIHKNYIYKECNSLQKSFKNFNYLNCFYNVV